jgi:hypothetical protein
VDSLTAMNFLHKRELLKTASGSEASRFGTRSVPATRTAAAYVLGSIKVT